MGTFPGIFHLAHSITLQYARLAEYHIHTHPYTLTHSHRHTNLYVDLYTLGLMDHFNEYSYLVPINYNSFETWYIVFLYLF